MQDKPYVIVLSRKRWIISCLLHEPLLQPPVPPLLDQLLGSEGQPPLAARLRLAEPINIMRVICSIIKSNVKMSPSLSLCTKLAITNFGLNVELTDLKIEFETFLTKYCIFTWTIV